MGTPVGSSLPSIPTDLLALIPKPPFSSPFAILGEVPLKRVDVPIASIFLVLYACAGIIDLIIFKNNQKRGHRFFWTEMMASLCISRVITMALRITQAFYPSNVRLAIASNIFVLAGVLILFAINLIFAERIFLAMHPKAKKYGFLIFKLLQALIPAALMILICSYVLQAYTLDPDTKLTEFDAQRAGSCYLLFIAFLPLPVTAVSFILPHKRESIESFGAGHWYTKVAVMLTGTVLLVLGAAFRVSVSFLPTRPVDNPAWYHSRTCFWIFNFVIEISVIYFYILARVDKRFHIANRIIVVKQTEDLTSSDLPRELGKGDGMRIYITDEEQL